jgi:hypothetical protein
MLDDKPMVELALLSTVALPIAVEFRKREGNPWCRPAHGGVLLLKLALS